MKTDFGPKAIVRKKSELHFSRQLPHPQSPSPSPLSHIPPRCRCGVVDS